MAKHARQITLTLEPEIKNRIEAMAESLEVSVPALCRQLINTALALNPEEALKSAHVRLEFDEARIFLAEQFHTALNDVKKRIDQFLMERQR